MKPNSLRMNAAIKFVTEHPGTTKTDVITHLMSGNIVDTDSSAKKIQRTESRAYKGAASVVERIIKDRLVRQDATLWLYPWDEKRKVFAELLERAAFVAPDDGRKVSTLEAAANAWGYAGDDNRSRILNKIASDILTSKCEKTPFVDDQAPRLQA